MGETPGRKTGRTKKTDFIFDVPSFLQLTEEGEGEREVNYSLENPSLPVLLLGRQGRRNKKKRRRGGEWW